jgi:hypothetical protein
MKILKLLNKKYLPIILALTIFNCIVYAEEKPVDIWNIDQAEQENITSNNKSLSNESGNQQVDQPNIYNLQPLKQIDTVHVDPKLNSEKVKIIGLYDPGDHSLKIDMWSNSNGDQLKNLFLNIKRLNLSEDASNLMNILMLTNAYAPNINMTEKEFLRIKSDWLIRNNNRDLIEEYLIKNQILNLHPELSRFLTDHYLSESNIDKACEIFSKNSEIINDEYLSKFNLYCLINEGKYEEAQLILDLKRELGFKDKYFEKKLNYLFEFTDIPDVSISENSILEFHLAHKTNPDFFFEPKNKTNPLIWKYLSTSNLLFNIEEIDIKELEKISLIEKATNDKNYSEDELFSLYKRFQFNINQLLNAEVSYKTLTNIEARALIYQKILLESDVKKKLKLIQILKDLFINDNFSNAFDNKLKDFLKDIDIEDVPSDLTSFYYKYLESRDEVTQNIKFNKDILYQSKLINYFNGDYTKSKAEKELDNFLKKIKKNKKYFITKKDIIFIESMKSDGIKISKKYDDLYEIDTSDTPSDIQIMINNREIGTTILRLIEIIGEDKLEALDEETLFFIINALNKLNIDQIRNKILLKVLPLKV